ncbi:MAG: hypothetical protein U0736_26365 [Gemmataceae bacterium]
MNPVIPPAGPVTGRRLRVEGTLEAVHTEDATFAVRLADGRLLAGRLVGPPVKGLARLAGRQVVLFGVATVGPGNTLTEVEADGFLPADGEWWVVEPDELPMSEEVGRELAERRKAVQGQWPGDETDEQIDRALRELS